MGGFGNVKGAVLASFIIGIAESLTAGYIGPTYKHAIPFVVIVIILLFKPRGIFGKKVGI